MRRVVVTGLGIISPLGAGVKRNWEAALRGESGIDRVTRFDASDFPTRIAGEVKNFKADDYIDRKDVKKMDRFIQFAIAAAEEAMADSALRIGEEISERTGVIMGAGLGGLESIERYHEAFLSGGVRKISPFFIPMLIVNLAPGQISMIYGAKGPNLSITTACAASTHAIGEAYQAILRDEADVIIAGGSEATITPLGLGGFCAMKALSTRNDDPAKASRPFDSERDGFVMGEGGGILILEELEFARKRGARIYAEVGGYAATADAHHITAPAPEGEGAARCMAEALKTGGIDPREVDYINAHGTSTKYNDLFETMAIKSVFGDHAYNLAVSSTKSMTGHLLGAAGAVEAIFTILAMDQGVIPPTINLENGDPGCDLDYVPNSPRKGEIKVALSNSFGFGGTNGVVVFKRYKAA
ncbi:MAG: beta-ketoacyl-ACP synthase II [Deltaproteobacteria bacterium]|nr:beta-ketoacyl-ACP synthase II [Deltaproteobacteria bacterium]NIS78157.1 beta-ketoacyl-ACP synthase II [Deltaproteobacteria bacterium]